MSRTLQTEKEVEDLNQIILEWQAGKRSAADPLIQLTRVANSLLEDLKKANKKPSDPVPGLSKATEELITQLKTELAEKNAKIVELEAQVAMLKTESMFFRQDAPPGQDGGGGAVAAESPRDAGAGPA